MDWRVHSQAIYPQEREAGTKTWPALAEMSSKTSVAANQAHRERSPDSYRQGKNRGLFDFWRLGGQEKDCLCVVSKSLPWSVRAISIILSMFQY